MKPSDRPGQPGLLVKESVFRTPPYEHGKTEEELRRELGVERIVKMASNENPLGPSPKVLEVLRADLPKVHRYPDSSYFELRRKLCDKLGVPEGMTIVGCGSCEVMKWLCEAVLEPGDQVLAADIAFPIYHTLPLLFDSRALTVPLEDDLRLNMDAFLQAGGDNTKAVFIASPNNPTGLLVDPNELDEMLHRVPDNRLIALDLAYVEYASEAYEQQTLELVRRHDNLILLRSFSKVHGLAGLRVGYGIANEELIALLDRVRVPFSVNAFGERAALAALDDDDHVQRSLRTNAEGMAYLSGELNEMGLHVWPSSANFVLVDVEREATEVFETLLRRGLIVRPMRAPRIRTTVRITVGTMDQNEMLVSAMREVLSR